MDCRPYRRACQTVDTKGVFCAEPACADRGKAGAGNIKVHCRKAGRFRCTTCKKTFAATKGTPFSRLHKDQPLFLCVVTHGQRA